MTKNQQLLLGVGVVGVAGYFYWKSKQPKVGFVNYGGAPKSYDRYFNTRKKKGMVGLVKNYEGASKLASTRVQTGSTGGKIFKGFAMQNAMPQQDAQFRNSTGFFEQKPGAFSWK